MQGYATKRSWKDDRFMVCLVIALGLHAFIVLGVHFGITLTPTPRLADTLDVVLVKWQSEKAPEDADFLAQANQKGGGETMAKQRPSLPVSGDVPIPEQGKDAVQSTEQLPAPRLPEQEVIVVESDQAAPLEQTQIEQPEADLPSAARLMRQSMEIASLQPEVSRQRRADSRLPVREYISANTKEYEFASYMSAWVSKVERVGNLNYPSELRQRKLHGNLVLSVGINQNGSIESIDVKRSSGVKEIDDAARKIVTLAAPYAPLPDNISERVDILHITRTWRFESSFGAD